MYFQSRIWSGLKGVFAFLRHFPEGGENDEFFEPRGGPWENPSRMQFFTFLRKNFHLKRGQLQKSDGRRILLTAKVSQN
jgi:hypothetical protein